MKDGKEDYPAIITAWFLIMCLLGVWKTIEMALETIRQIYPDGICF